jgi:hypothetical protein
MIEAGESTQDEMFAIWHNSGVTHENGICVVGAGIGGAKIAVDVTNAAGGAWVRGEHTTCRGHTNSCCYVCLPVPFGDACRKTVLANYQRPKCARRLWLQQDSSNCWQTG